MPPHDSSVPPDALPDAMLLGIASTSRHWSDIAPHLVPLAGFFAGVLTSKHLRTRLGIRSVLFGLALEIATIFALGWLPSRPSAAPEPLF